MHSKLAIGGLSVAVAFLLATNPTVVDAASQITGKQIKNGSLKGKDIKDGSLTASDLAAGTIPSAPAPASAPAVQVKQLKRLAANVNASFPAVIDPAFVGNPVTVSVDGNDVVSASGTVHIEAATAGDDTDVAICYRPSGSAAAPSALGGVAANNLDIDLLVGDNLLAAQAADLLPAGSYSVGLCIHPLVAMTVENVVGTVTVLDGTGPLG